MNCKCWIQGGEKRTGRKRKQSENGNKIDDSTWILKYMFNSIKQRAFDKMVKLDGQTGQTKPTIAMGKRWKIIITQRKRRRRKELDNINIYQAINTC